MKTARYWISILFICLIPVLLGACNLTRPDAGEDTEIVDDTGEVITPSSPSVPSNTDGADTILIPGGTFWMGSAADEAGAQEDEQPRHQVLVDGFYFYTHEVTNEMYTECVQAGACPPVQVMNSGPTTHTEDPAFADHPVVGVDWNMADDYCTWAGGRLPTEAEWEFAARGEESPVYPWGADDPGCERVNMLGCLVPPDTVAVGSYLLGNSPFEVWDLAGNVWEWVSDWYDPDYYALSPARSPNGPNAPHDFNNPLKVVRGGGLYSEPLSLRAANRSAADPLRAFDDVGFRCVAEGENPPPSGMIPVPEGHEMVPPDPLDGGGERAEDPEHPEPFASMGESAATCPDSAGNITIYAEAESSDTGEYSVTVEEIPFDCSYDDAIGLLTCTGPEPAATEYPDAYHVKIYFPGGGLIGHQYPEIPVDCPSEGLEPPDITASASCPEDDGLVTLTITSNPPITWDTTLMVEGSVYVDMPCWPTLEGETRCTVPARAPGESYSLSLHGFDGDGMEYYFWTAAVIPDGCPVGFLDATVSPTCSEDGPAVQVMYNPALAALVSVSTIGVPLDCIGWAPGVQVCGVLPGTSGSPSVITTCFEGEGCTDWDITVPDCSGPVGWYFDEVTSACYPGLGPVAVIHYEPADLPLVAANANGFDLTCYGASEAGWYMCSGIPGSPGSEMTISFCLSDGTCFSEPIIVEDCSGEAGEEWRLIAVGCHDESRIYFAIDTYFDFRGTGTPFTYTATDEDGTAYSCELHPTVAGRIYCSGIRPESPGTLDFCIQIPGDVAPTCLSFPEYDVWVTGTPPCATVPAEPFDACAQYTDYFTCGALHKGECAWDYTNNVCHSVP